MNRRWNIAAPCAGAPELAAQLKTSPIVAQILLSRGFDTAQTCRDFLNPTLNCLHKPAMIPGLTRAAERIAQAIRDGQKIVIYGDYDVDGMTATSILWHAIRVLGGKPAFYIPHRVDEGYGLNAEAISQICNEGAGLIITVDCGVTAIGQAKVAQERNVDLIITDHHEWKSGKKSDECEITDSASVPPPALPECYAVVHPRLPVEGVEPYPNPSLCGAGVAFKLAWGVGMVMNGSDRVSEAFRTFLIDATALAALGTIADVVPLTNENRAMAHFGLKGLRASKLAGLIALIESAGLGGQALQSFDVGFKLAPRLNACGRLGHARLAVEMLTTDDSARATQIADYLEQQNRARQSLEKKIFAEAVAQVHQQGNVDDCRALVLGKEDWHPGVIGIVASRIVEHFHRPAVLIAMNNGHGQGSARSISGFHLARAMEACGEHLESFGGHEMAAGLKISSDRIDDFRKAFCDHARQCITQQMLIPEIRIDAVAELREIHEALVKDLSRLGPFGQGNPKPLLCCRDVELTAPARRVGASGDHLQLYIKQGETILKCIAFGYGPMDAQLPAGKKLDLAVDPRINEYNGRTSVELEVKDLQFAAL